MQLGKKIKSLRLQNSMTQEMLANHLGLSAQAVSKWENDVTTPDIQLLPELSAYFGVTIDELFQISDETHLDRIDNMLETKRRLTQDEFEYAADYLRNKLEDNDKRGRCLTLLGELYHHKATSYLADAEYYAKEALKENPTSKANHVILCKAQGGTLSDWNYVNHHTRIQFYYEFVKENPTYGRGYMWLIDELIADNRLEEAEAMVGEMKRIEDDFRVTMYLGEIQWKKGNQTEALEIWQKMREEDPENWLVFANSADKYAYAGRWDEAIQFNRKAFELQPSPKYVDAQECIAHIHEINGEYDLAVKAWEEYIAVLETEWGIVEGELVDFPHREIKRLKSM